MQNWWWCCWLEWRSASWRSWRITSLRIILLYERPLSWILHQKTLILVPNPHRSKQNPKIYIYSEREREIPLRSGLWQRLTRRTLSLANFLRGLTTESMTSISPILCVCVRERERRPKLEINPVCQTI